MTSITGKTMSVLEKEALKPLFPLLPVFSQVQLDDKSYSRNENEIYCWCVDRL